MTTHTESNSEQTLETGASGHVHRFNAVRVPPEFGHSYLRCAYCGLSKHLADHDASTCDICSRVSANVVAPTVDQMWEALKAECCKKPEDAKLIVFCSEEKFKKALAPFTAASPVEQSETVSVNVVDEQGEIVFGSTTAAAAPSAAIQEGDHDCAWPNCVIRHERELAAAKPSGAARQAAVDIYHEMFKLGGLDEGSVINGIAAIISRYCFSAPAESVGPSSQEPEYVVIDGERRRVVPCPDNRPDCEVLHTEPAPTTEEGAG